jgi:hypothetical protein
MAGAQSCRIGSRRCRGPLVTQLTPDKREREYCVHGTKTIAIVTTQAPKNGPEAPLHGHPRPGLQRRSSRGHGIMRASQRRDTS